MIRYLDSADAAKAIGVQPQTFRQWRSRGLTPEPDAMTGRQPGWLPETIERWPDKPKPRAKR